MNIKTIILCGGYGTRIRDVIEDLPKPMIPIGGHPIVWHIMHNYAKFNVKEFILCLGYKGEVIKNYFLNYQNYKNDFTINLLDQTKINHTNAAQEDWQITFAETGLNAFTGARVKKIKKYVADHDCFLLTYGDGVGNIDISKLIEFHKSHGKLMTVTGAHPPGRFGELTIDGDQVIGFNEKPQAIEGWISAGFFVCNKKIFDYLNDEENLIFEKNPIENITKDGQLMVYKHQGFWHPMDTSRDYQLLNELWLSGNAPWIV